jgi:hypothetical protein
MYEYQEALPETKSSRRNFVHFTPGQRTLLIEQDRHRDEYHISRIPAEGGQAWRFNILGRVPPAEPNHYDVFVADRTDLHDSCECLGFLRHGHCKHTAALRALLENQWV